jgi:hypothetical protein
MDTNDYSFFDYPNHQTLDISLLRELYSDDENEEIVDNFTYKIPEDELEYIP